MAGPTTTPASTDPSDQLVCTSCGAANAKSSKVCFKCGSALALASATTPDGGIQTIQADIAVVPASSISGELAALVKVEINEVQERLLDRIATIDKQVADLQVDQVKAGKPWWQNPSILIALSAFLLSLTATTFSLIQTRQREQRDARVELRGLIQRLSQIPRESATLSQVYTDPLVIANLGGQLQQENAVLAKQAREVMSVIPDQVTSGEYILVANALATSNLIDDAITMYRKAENVILDYNDGVALYRSEAQLLYYTGQPDQGRAYYQRAAEIFERFPTSSEFVSGPTGIETQIYWSYAEYGVGECANSRMHAADARERYNAFIKKYPSAKTSQAINDSRIKAVESATRLCLPKTTPTPTP